MNHTMTTSINLLKEKIIDTDIYIYIYIYIYIVFQLLPVGGRKRHGKQQPTCRM